MDGLIALALAKKASASATKTFQGTGAPTSTVVAKKGDLYLDSTNNQVYMCTNYIDPNIITDLTGITITFNNILNAIDLNTTYKGVYSVNYKLVTGGSEKVNNQIECIDGNSGSLFYGGVYNSTVYSTSRISSGFDPWTNTDAKVITITGGTAATDTKFIAFILRNAQVSGVGSTWIEVTAESTPELPPISTGDAGKVLTVNSGETGTEWTTPSSGVAFIEGSIDPTNYNGSKGDIYYNSTSDNLFVKINDSISGLEGHKFGYKSQVDASMITETTEFNITFKYNSESSSGTPETCTGLKLYANGDVAVLTNAYWQQTNNGVWSQNPVGTEFVSGTDLTNPLLVAWVMANAITIDGQPINSDYWLNFKDAVLPSVTPSDEGKVLQVNSSGSWSTSNAFEEETWTFTLSDDTQITRTVLIKVVE